MSAVRSEEIELDAGVVPETETTFGAMIVEMPQNEMDRLYVSSLMNRARNGELDMFALRSAGTAIGVIWYRCIDGEAELIYGFLRLSYAGTERAFLEKVVERLAQAGVNAVRAGFTWPNQERFIAAAAELGFSSVHRISMARDVDDRHLFCYAPAPGIQVFPWSSWYFEDVCRIIYEESELADRTLYPLFGSLDGARRLLLSIVQDRHGTFMPGLSAVCQSDGVIVGLILCALVADGSVLVLDIAVSKAHRRNGAGTRMLEYLVGKTAAIGNRQVVLAVTADNTPAIGLYKKMGFREVARFDQYVLALNR